VSAQAAEGGAVTFIGLVQIAGKRVPTGVNGYKKGLWSEPLARLGPPYDRDRAKGLMSRACGQPR